MSEREIARIRNPWLQAGGLAFLALYAVAILAALAWLASNVREIPAARRAVVLRMGALNRIVNAGLLFALPKPFEEVELVPSAETVLQHDLAADEAQPQASILPTPDEEDDTGSTAPQSFLTDAQASLGNRLTGDAGVVQLDVKVFYSVIDPYEYVLQQTHLGPLLNRLVSQSIVRVCATRDLDAILVARPELVDTNQSLAEQRERLRGDILDGVNRELAQMHALGAGSGIRLVRIDLITRLHPDAVDAFNSVLTASQEALQEVANARTGAETVLQLANQDSDRKIQAAQAAGTERTAKAQADTSDVMRLATALKSGLDPGLPLRMYRERIASILGKASSVTTVDPSVDSRLIIRGATGEP